MENNENDLGMGLFGSGNELELDFNFNSVVPDEQKTGEPDDSDKTEGKVDDPETKDKLSDGDSPQEKVAKDGGAIDKGDESENSSPNLYNSLAATLKEQGLLSTTDESSINDAEELAKAFKKEIKQSEYADLNEGQREFLDAIREGVPLERFQEHKNDETNLAQITIEDITNDEELRRRIIYQDLVNQGLAEESALKFTERSVSNGTDIEDAESALPKIKEHNNLKYEQEKEATKADVIANQKKVEEEKQALKDAIMSPKNIFEGYNATENFKDTVFKDMNTVIGYTEEGTPENKLMKYRRENPVDFDAKLYYLFTLTNEFQNVQRFQENSTSSAVSNLERAMQQSHFAPTGGQPGFIQDPNSYSSGFGDEIVL